ncbi:Sister chromatid cohesion protein 2 [Tritrichomonas musculus]|uniref:Sister chromatid cohesion protein 2 n=1 Tax=Tritrichomonas musculus TaxID=1915356 RepID=A0ABR2HUM7_9EUKA
MEAQNADDINKFAQFFDNLLDNDESTRKAASDQILGMLQTNPPFMIDICTSIIMQDDISLRSQRLSFVILCKIFQPTNEQPINIIIERYMSLSNLQRQKLNSAFFRGLLFPQQDIYQQAAFLVSLIVVIEEPQTTVEILNALQDLLISGKYSETAHYASIISFNEIYSSNHVQDLFKKCKNFDQFLILQKNYYYNFLREAFNYPTTFITLLVKTLTSFIQSCSVHFDNRQEQGQILSLFESLLPHVIDSDLFSEITHLIFKLVEIYYLSESLDIERIISITLNGINSNDASFVCYSNQFWKDVADNEIRIINNNILYEKCQSEIKAATVLPTAKYIPEIVRTHKTLKNYTIMFAKRAISDVFLVLTKIDSNDTNVEDLTLNRPHYFAFSLIKKIFNIDPHIVIAKVDELFDISVNSQSWTIHHAFLNALMCMSPRPTDRDTSLIVQKIYEKSSNFILSCTISENDRLVETAISTLCTISKNYSIYSTKQILPTFLTGIEKYLTNSNYLIAVRSLELLQHLVNKMDQEYVDEIFGDLIRIISVALNHPDYLTNDLFYKIFESFQKVIQCASKHSAENVEHFLNKFIIVNLLKSTTLMIEPQSVYMMQQCLFQTIRVIFEHFSDELINDAGELLKLLFNPEDPLLRKMKREVTDDVLLTLTKIISSLGEYVNDFVQFIINYIDFSLQSGSPSIIKNSIIVIAALFDSLLDINLILDKLPGVIGFVLNSLENKLFNPEFYPEVGKNLYFVIIKITKNQFFDVTLRDKFFEIYRRMYSGNSSLPVDFLNDVDFANSVLECVCLGYSGIIQFSQFEEDRSFLLQNVKELFVPARYFIKLNQIYDKTLKAFLKLLDAAMSYVPRKKNHLIRININSSLLILARAKYADSDDKITEDYVLNLWIKYINL